MQKHHLCQVLPTKQARERSDCCILQIRVFECEKRMAMTLHTNTPVPTQRHDSCACHLTLTDGQSQPCHAASHSLSWGGKYECFAQGPGNTSDLRRQGTLRIGKLSEVGSRDLRDLLRDLQKKQRMLDTYWCGSLECHVQTSFTDSESAD